MRTLTLLTALLLLAFQARAQTLQETADQVPAQDQPGVDDQDMLGDEDQDVAVSFTGEERFTRQLMTFDILQKAKGIIAKILKKIFSRISANIGRKVLRKSCLCRQPHQCPHSKVNKVLERVSWVCRISGRRYKLCCK